MCHTATLFITQRFTYLCATTYIYIYNTPYSTCNYFSLCLRCFGMFFSFFVRFCSLFSLFSFFHFFPESYGRAGGRHDPRSHGVAHLGGILRIKAWSRVSRLLSVLAHRWGLCGSVRVWYIGVYGVRRARPGWRMRKTNTTLLAEHTETRTFFVLCIILLLFCCLYKHNYTTRFVRTHMHIRLQ